MVCSRDRVFLYNISLRCFTRFYRCAHEIIFQQYQIRCQLEDKALVLVHLVKTLKHVLCFASSVDTSHRLTILTGERRSELFRSLHSIDWWSFILYFNLFGNILVTFTLYIVKLQWCKITEEFGGIKVAEYSSTLTVQQRNKVMRDFSLGNIQLLVAKVIVQNTFR